MAIAAAQYVRMSTDKQPLSIETQKETIRRYAEEHSLDVVKTYSDEARSGVQLEGRLAMQQLLRDVMDPACGYSVILVLDVSRWGRFQDVDESAYYEYHCRKHGVQVRFVQEPFHHQATTPFDSVFKQFKRVIAAEYARELGVKCRAGQICTVTLGYATGLLPCLGYRRQAVSMEGSFSKILVPHERKPHVTDRVRWVLASSNEVEMVRQLFLKYAETPASLNDLVRQLAISGVRSHDGRQIQRGMLRDLLTSKLTLGVFEWGAKDRQVTITGIAKLAEPIRNDTMVPAIVDQGIWDAVQVKLFERGEARRAGFDKAKLIDALRTALQKNPRLSWSTFKEAGLVNPLTYRKHFGSITEAYRLAGRISVDPEWPGIHPSASSVRIGKRFVADVYAMLKDQDVAVQVKPKYNLLIVQGVHVKVRMAMEHRKGRGETYWMVEHLERVHVAEGEWLLVMRLNREAGTGKDFFLMSPEQRRVFSGRLGIRSREQLCLCQLLCANVLCERLSRIGMGATEIADGPTGEADGVLLHV